VTSAQKHRPGCIFGSGFYRLEMQSGYRRFYQTQAELEHGVALLHGLPIRRVVRDGYCLDELPSEASPDVIDGDTFLNMPQRDAQEALGGVSEQEYIRAYRAVEDVVLARDRAVAAGSADRPSIVIKKKGKRVLDV